MRHIQFLILLLLLSACCPKQTEVYMSDFLRDYAVYQPGTWWVYVNDSTQERDSVSIYDLNLTWGEWGTQEKESCPPPYKIESHEMFVSHSLEDVKSRIGVIASYGEINENVVQYFGGQEVLFINPEYESTSHDLEYVEQLDSLTVLNQTFYDIVVFRNYQDKMAGSVETLNYYARHYWLIRKEIVPTGETWNLAKSNIVQ